MLLSTYGLLLLLDVVVAVPAGTFAVYVVPTMKEYGYFQGAGALLLWALDFFFKWWWEIIQPVFTFLSAIVTIRYFSRRWNRIVEAL